MKDVSQLVDWIEIENWAAIMLMVMFFILVLYLTTHLIEFMAGSVIGEPLERVPR